MSNNCSKEKRICVSCGEEYMPNSNRQKYCKECARIKEREYKLKYKDKGREMDRQRWLKNKDHMSKIHKEWCEKNKQHLRDYNNEYRKKRKKNDPNFKISRWCRTHIFRCLNSKKTKHTFDILDYTPDELRLHLESQFKEGMSWDNHGTLWHIDHIRPLCSFNFVNEDGTPNYDVIREANSLGNLQPLYIEENLSKGGRIN